MHCICAWDLKSYAVPARLSSSDDHLDKFQCPVKTIKPSHPNYLFSYQDTLHQNTSWCFQ